MAARAKLIIAYLGTHFCGWQRQAVGRSVQGELEAALTAMLRHPTTVTGAGRTDAGVHAQGQVAHLELPGPVPPPALVRGLNARLASDVRIRAAALVAPDFDARRDARAKRYVYRLRWRASSLPWHDLRCATRPLIGQPEALGDALELLVGEHDMASFTVPDPGPPATLRILHRVECRHLGAGLDLHFVGQGFLRYQVRRMVGAALEVGDGRRDLAWLAGLLEEPRPGAPIRTAPARGLTLERVYYRGFGPPGTAVLDSAP